MPSTKYSSFRSYGGSPLWYLGTTFLCLLCLSFILLCLLTFAGIKVKVEGNPGHGSRFIENTAAEKMVRQKAFLMMKGRVAFAERLLVWLQKRARDLIERQSFHPCTCCKNFLWRLCQHWVLNSVLPVRAIVWWQWMVEREHTRVKFNKDFIWKVKLHRVTKIYSRTSTYLSLSIHYSETPYIVYYHILPRRLY